MTGRVRVEGPPESGVTGYGGKSRIRADFKPEFFDELVDNHGSRLAWAQSARCPCKPINNQTSQPNPDCPLCSEHPGWTFFGPVDYQLAPEVGQLDDVQKAIVAEHGSAVIRGVFSGVSEQVDAFTKIGEWVKGTALLTVREVNRVGFNDRLIDLDSELTYSEVVTLAYAGSPSTPQAPKLRYRPIAINAVIDEDGVRYRQNVGFRLTRAGRLEWIPGHAPRAKKRATVHYLYHAVWRVWDWTHAYRRAQVAAKQQHPTTPLGNPTALPRQVLLRLEHLVEGEASGQ